MTPDANANVVLNHIGGERTPAADGRTFPDENPATGETIAELARSGPADVDAAVAAARASLDGPYGPMTVPERADLLDPPSAR